MEQGNIKKASQLGMPQGTASNRLRKAIIFDLLCKQNLNYCFQCSQIIDNVSELSIEHKVPYLDSENPVQLFFDLDNIAFSHLNCNMAASRKNTRYIHPSRNSYQKGCRCKDCQAINAKAKKDWRQRVKER